MTGPGCYRCDSCCTTELTMAMMVAEARERPRILLPGIRRLPPGVERYVVPAAGSVLVTVLAGDTLRIVNTEGGQTCEIVAFDNAARQVPGILGRPDSGPAAGLAAMLTGGGEAARSLLDTLARKGWTSRFDHAVRLFGPGTPAGANEDIAVEEDGFIIVAAPGEPMEVSAQWPPTPLELFVHRKDAAVAAERNLPDPLAEPRAEFRIGPGTAQAYEVKEGEYIQVLDVEGRQCSDFQTLSLAALDRGLEREIDPTATRVLNGAAYPAPGLFSKLFDGDLQPSIEIIQDTVGRHDSFNFACTAKYYDDVGYPGHANCTDNMNGALKPYDVRPRSGWQAMNFFYNSLVDDNYQIYLDEPWSRPGDYVLCRALQDVVCVNTSCPDAISAANGWNPTDILVRIYPGDNLFRKAIANRPMPDSDPQMTRDTGFHGRTAARTRNFTEYNGFWLPTHYTNHGVIDEYWACRERVTAMDLSPLRKFEVTGPDAGELMQRTLTRNVRRMADHHVVYSAMCYEHGGMIDDGTLFRLSETGYRWIGGTDFGGEWLRARAKEWGLRALVRSSTDQLHNLAIQGPRSRDLLGDIVWTPPVNPRVDEINWFRFTVGRIGDHNGVPVVVSRTGYTGELGYEVWCHPRDAEKVWDAVFEAGEPHGIVPLGLDGLDLLRIEAGLVFAGQEFDDQTDPFEAGIGFTVGLKTTEEDFVGRQALERRKAHPQRKLVGLELEGNEAAAHGDCVRLGRAQVGVVTSGMRSPLLNRNIALARMDVNHASIGDEVEVG
ncbi:MAG: DUF1989 domain-containing protein, partial [bacterium]|nr:DUF1989 domain-containing protein [bacterium]